MLSTVYKVLAPMLIITVTPIISVAQPLFMGLGDLPGGEFGSSAVAISGDGNVVVGTGRSEKGHEAYRWTTTSGMVGLGMLEPGSTSYAHDVSYDGTVIVGMSNMAAFKWTTSQGMVPLENTTVNSMALGISPDGSLVSGMINDHACIWDSTGELTYLPQLSDHHDYSSARAISNDNSIIVGSSISVSGHEAVYWANGAVNSLGDLPGGTIYSVANSISSDGSFIVGASNSEHCQTADRTEAFIWATSTGMQALGDLPGGIFHSRAYGVSADGSTVVGTAYSEIGQEVFIWTKDTGMENLKNYLVNQYSMNLDGWQLKNVTGGSPISDDGQTIVGYGINPDGHQEAWLVHLPEPSTLFFLLFGFVLHKSY